MVQVKFKEQPSITQKGLIDLNAFEMAIGMGAQGKYTLYTDAGVQDSIIFNNIQYYWLFGVQYNTNSKDSQIPNFQPMSMNATSRGLL